MMETQTLIDKYETETGIAFLWADDLLTARMMLEKGGAWSGQEAEWLCEVIESSNHSERRWLRAGIELTPSNLWYDYNLQQWIKDRGLWCILDFIKSTSTAIK